MRLIFLSLQGNLEEISKEIYSVIGVSSYSEGDSANVLGGTYYNGILQQCTIKIELNSYSYEEYNVFIKVENSRRIRLSPLDDQVADHIIPLLLSAFRVPVAKEIKYGELEVFTPGPGNDMEFNRKD